MTWRAVLLGMVGVILLCGLIYFNDAVLHQTNMVGNFMPISVYGGLIIFVLLINPLLYRAWKRLALSGAELAVILALTLAACCIPGSGLMRVFTNALVMPFHWERTYPAWQAGNNVWRKGRILQQLPSYLLADVNARNDNSLLGGFIQGSGSTGHLSLAQVPWAAWRRTLSFWIPLLLLLWIGLLGLSLVVHQQWSDHEHLPYPIATLAHSLLPAAKQHVSTTLRNGLFWLGTLPILLIHINNYACLWSGPAHYLIPLPLQLKFISLQPLFPTLSRGGSFTWLIFQPFIYFTVIGVGYFLASDVALALGIGPLLYNLVCGILAGYGVSMSGGTPALYEFLAFGAYLGMLLTMLYTGRRYYADVLRAACGLPTAAFLHPYTIWGARVFFLAMAGFVGWSSLLGKLDWQLAALYLGILVMMFLVMSRILAETGVFFIQSYFNPHTILLGLFGAGALGPQAILLMAFFTIICAIDPREAFMPFMVNSLKLVDYHKVNVGRIGRWTVVALLLGFAVAVPVTLYLQYDRGANMIDAFATTIVPSMAFNQAITAEQQLMSQGILQHASAVTGFGHFANMHAQPKALLALGMGLALMLLFSAARLRFTRWPIHPIFFLVWVSFPAAWFAFSFFLGWLIKALVVRFGGIVTYQKLKAFMIGVIAGELGAGICIMLFCWTYSLLGLFGITHELPKGYWIFPG